MVPQGKRSTFESVNIPGIKILPGASLEDLLREASNILKMGLRCLISFGEGVPNALIFLTLALSL
jgi:hypothetical protein